MAKASATNEQAKATNLKKIIVPKQMILELSFFGKSKFAMFEAFCKYGFKGIEPQKADFTEEEYNYIANVMLPLITKQKNKRHG